jgi:thiol-disulfide isomerase/thioredoxin
MKLTIVFFALLFTTSAALAQGYEIKVTLKPFKNQYIYLGHYYGKQLPIIDSVKLNDKSEGVFKGNKKLGGGIYLVGYPDRSQYFEMLVDKNQKFAVAADTAAGRKLTFTNSPDNDEFVAYQQFMSTHGRNIDALMKQRAAQPKDSVAITAQIQTLNKQIQDYRKQLMAKNPEALLPALLRAMKEPEVPQQTPEAKKDSLFAYKYFKTHYWDGVNFWDERLARTPFFENRVDKYYEQLVYPEADSVIKEIDWMMGYASINEEMQKFLLLKFANRYLNQKYMWEDKVFVHLFEKYFSQKTYPWMNEAGKKVITDRAYSLMANIMGSPAANVELPDRNGKTTALYNIKAPYTLLVIWDPTCGHCKEVVPKLDSLYHAKWKGLGLQLFGLAKETEGTQKTWTDLIDQHKLTNWTHVYYSKVADKARVEAGIPGYSQLFDVQSFPTLYLLDQDKRIIAKKVTEQQIDEILEYRQKNTK